MAGGPDSLFGWRWIGRCVLIKRRQAMLLVAASSVIYALGLVFPISVQKAVDIIVTGKPGHTLVALLVAVLAATMLEAGLVRVRQTIIIDFATFIDRRISRIAFSHLVRARIDGTLSRGGETINRFAQARKIQTFVLNDVPRSVFEGGGLLVAIGGMIFYDRWVAGAVFLTSPIILVAVRSPLAKVRVASGDYFRETGRQQNVLSETVNALVTVKSLGLEGVRMRLWTSATDRLLQSLRRVMDLQREYAVVNQAASRLLLLAVTAVGCWRLATGHISVGDLLALQMLAGRITGPLLQSSDIYVRYQDVDVAVDQLAEFLRTPREVPSVRPASRRFGMGGIELRGVSLTYPNAARPALNGVDLVLPERGVVAIVGRNGSGKSTLVRVLLGLNRDYEGHILFAGGDLRGYDPRWLRGQIGTVDQDTVLFSGSIRSNICGDKHVDETALREALDFAGALQIVDELPNGLDAELTENGRTLSGGQRQRLSIARAVVRDPRVAFFDEPAAFLDAEAAVDLERRLARWGRERLLVLVSHHLAVTRDADRIIVLDQGRVAGTGRHDDLLASTPCYASLWNDYNRKLEMPDPIALRPDTSMRFPSSAQVPCPARRGRP